MNIKKIRNGIILISIGLVLLLNNLGQVGWTVWWSIFKLWPVFLMAWGIELIFRNSKLNLLALLSPLVWCLAILGPALTGEHRDIKWLSDPQYFNWEVEKSGKVKEISAVIDIGGRELDLSGGASNVALCSLTYFNEKPECKWTVEDSRGILEIYQKDKMPFPIHFDSPENVSKIFLNNSLPLDLQIFSRVSEAELDLSQLNLKNLDLDLRVNATEVKLPLKAGELDCKVKSKVGHLKLKVPKEAGLSIQNLTRLASTSFSNISLTHSDEGFTTPDFSKAKSKINLVIKGKILNLEVETY